MAIIEFENSTYRTAGDLPSVGSRAPELSLVNTRLQDVTLSNWMGKRKIINIFVSIDTDVCAESVRTFEQRTADLEDVVMLMVSCDLPFALSRFFEEHKIEHSLGLSALRNAGFGENYGVTIVEGPLEGLFARAVVVLDENNSVVYQQLIKDITTEPDYGSALRALGIDDEGSDDR